LVGVLDCFVMDIPTERRRRAGPTGVCTANSAEGNMSEGVRIKPLLGGFVFESMSEIIWSILNAPWRPGRGKKAAISSPSGIRAEP